MLNEYSPTQVAAIRQTVLLYDWYASDWLVEKLLAVAAEYGCNGFQAANELRKARQWVGAGQNTEPRTEAWFVAVLDARLRRHAEPRMVAGKAEECTGRDWGRAVIRDLMAGLPTMKCKEETDGRKPGKTKRRRKA
jgi:hypothetical protein